MNDVIVNPENYEEMVEKYKEREKEQTKKALERHDVDTVEELMDVGIKAIAARQTRYSSEYKPLKDRAIKVEPETQEVKTQKEQLQKEITAVFKKIHAELPSVANKLLRGRVKEEPRGG